MIEEKGVKIVTVDQIHDALEERQKPDRRQHVNGIPDSVNQERRRASRRGNKPNKA